MRTAAKLALIGIIAISIINIIDLIIESVFIIKIYNGSFDFNDIWEIIFKRSYIFIPICIAAFVFLGLLFLRISQTSKEIKTVSILAAAGTAAIILSRLYSLATNVLGSYPDGAVRYLFFGLNMAGLCLTIPFFITFAAGSRKKTFSTSSWLATTGVSLNVVMSLLLMFVDIYGRGLAPLLIAYFISYSALILCLPFFLKFCKTAEPGVPVNNYATGTPVNVHVNTSPTTSPITPDNNCQPTKRPIVPNIPMRKPK